MNGKKRKATKEPAPVEETADEEEPASDDSEDESDAENDQTTALLKGFESDDDEEDGEDEGNTADVPAIPDEKKLRKKLSKAKSDGGPGVIYVGYAAPCFPSLFRMLTSFSTAAFPTVSTSTR